MVGLGDDADMKKIKTQLVRFPVKLQFHQPSDIKNTIRKYISHFVFDVKWGDFFRGNSLNFHMEYYATSG